MMSPKIAVLFLPSSIHAPGEKRTVPAPSSADLLLTNVTSQLQAAFPRGKIQAIPERHMGWPRIAPPVGQVDGTVALTLRSTYGLWINTGCPSGYFDLTLDLHMDVLAGGLGVGRFLDRVISDCARIPGGGSPRERRDSVTLEELTGVLPPFDPAMIRILWNQVRGAAGETAYNELRRRLWNGCAVHIL